MPMRIARRSTAVTLVEGRPPVEEQHVDRRLASGARRTTDNRIKWNENSFTGTSYDMLRVKI